MNRFRDLVRLLMELVDEATSRRDLVDKLESFRVDLGITEWQVRNPVWLARCKALFRALPQEEQLSRNFLQAKCQVLGVLREVTVV